MRADVTETPNAQAVTTQIGAEPGSFIMIVEDDTSLRWLLSEALRTEGFTVLTAEDGSEAVQLYRQNAAKIWLVITDIMMPRMDGLTAALEMRKIDNNVFFIFMSAYDSERVNRIGIRMEDIPDCDFFRKPFSFKDMTSRIRRVENGT
jgi:DNA-binding response OmpR family regulator